MRPLGTLLAAAALLTVGCGARGGDPAHQALAETAARLGEIRSGTVQVRMIVGALRGTQSDHGFEITGPFALPPGARPPNSAPDPALPVGRLDYTQIAGQQRATVTLVSTGAQAFVEVDGTAYKLPPERVEQLRAAAGRPGGPTGFEQLQVGRWLRAPRLTPGPEGTDRIEAGLNVVPALNDLFALARALGVDDQMGLPPLEGREAERVQRAVRAARLEVLTGAEDRLLRRLAIDVELASGTELPPGLDGARMDFDLAVADVNAPVAVQAPPDPRPFPELRDAG